MKLTKSSAVNVPVKPIDTCFSRRTSSASSVGTVTIPAGQTSLTVITTALTPKSLIFLTSDDPAEIGAKATGANVFTIKLGAPKSQDLQVNWWILN